MKIKPLRLAFWVFLDALTIKIEVRKIFMLIFISSKEKHKFLKISFLWVQGAKRRQISHFQETDLSLIQNNKNVSFLIENFEVSLNSNLSSMHPFLALSFYFTEKVYIKKANFFQKIPILVKSSNKVTLHHFQPKIRSQPILEYTGLKIRNGL